MTAALAPAGRQGILPFVYRVGDREDVTAHAGLPLVLETMRALRLDELVRQELPSPKRKRGYLPAHKLETLITLFAAGGERIEDVRILSEDKGLGVLLGSPIPSPDALLDFLGQFHDPKAWGERPAEKKAFVPAESFGLVGLDAINREVVTRGANREQKTATIDHDGTIVEAHKREAKVAYEGTRGYQPLVAVWAEEDLIVADQFRDGNVAGGEDPLTSAKKAFANLPEWIERRYFRADSASYYSKLLKWLVEEKIGFTISADMTKELRKVCQAVPESQWVLFEKRQSEQVDIAEVEFTPGEWSRQAEPLRYAVVRFTPSQNDLFDAPERKHLAVVSNRRDFTAAQLMRWHWEKAGTVEHTHRVMKDELAAGTMPSDRFGVNAAWFRINAIAFNILTILKRRALPENIRTARPKRLRFEFFTIPAKLVLHGRQLSVRVSASEERLKVLVEARKRLLELHEQTPSRRRRSADWRASGQRQGRSPAPASRRKKGAAPETRLA